MKDGPNIVGIAALIGDRARAEILTALLGGQALTATELTAVADVTKQTMSAHLAKLVEAKLVAVESQGRHRYFRLADDDVAQLLESLMGVAYRTGAAAAQVEPARAGAAQGARLLRPPRRRARRARVRRLAASAACCATATTGSSSRPPASASSRRSARISTSSHASRRPMCRLCLDWSVRRHHLAGLAGAALLQRCYDLGWARREKDSRVVAFTPRGEREFRERFAV